MQWGIRKEDSLAKDLSDDLIEKMELDPVNKFTIIIDDIIQIIIDYGVLPGGPIKLFATITNLETNDEVTSGMMVAEKEEDIQLILEKFLGTAYLLRK